MAGDVAGRRAQRARLNNSVVSYKNVDELGCVLEGCGRSGEGWGWRLGLPQQRRTGCGESDESVWGAGMDGWSGGGGWSHCGLSFNRKLTWNPRNGSLGEARDARWRFGVLLSYIAPHPSIANRRSLILTRWNWQLASAAGAVPLVNFLCWFYPVQTLDICSVVTVSLLPMCMVLQLGLY